MLLLRSGAFSMAKPTMITCGSLFAGIGGFELGAQWAFEAAGIPHKVLFQVEQNKFCQKVLKKHWPEAQIFDDVRAVGRHNLPDVDILMGGFPCQDISVAGLQKGIINGKKSSIWFEMLRVIGELRCPIVVLENVPAILRVGGPVVVGGLAKIGYDCEWTIVSAKQFGACHLRKRWFCVATNTNRVGLLQHAGQPKKIQSPEEQKLQREKGQQSDLSESIYGADDATNADRDGSGQTFNRRPISSFGKRCAIQQGGSSVPTNADRACGKRNRRSIGVQQKFEESNMSLYNARRKASYWSESPTESPLCSVDDGIPDRLARLRALGNAIVPQCSEYIFEHIIQSHITNKGA